MLIHEPARAPTVSRFAMISEISAGLCVTEESLRAAAITKATVRCGREATTAAGMARSDVPMSRNICHLARDDSLLSSGIGGVRRLSATAFISRSAAAPRATRKHTLPSSSGPRTALHAAATSVTSPASRAAMSWNPRIKVSDAVTTGMTSRSKAAGNALSTNRVEPRPFLHCHTRARSANVTSATAEVRPITSSPWNAAAD